MQFIDKILKRWGYIPNKPVTRTLTCAWCAEQFNWTGKLNDMQPIYCSPNHQKKSGEARRKRKKAELNPPKKKPPRKPEVVDLNKVGRCPTPFKIVFRTAWEAEEVIKRVDPTMHVYRCSCGAMHIGHPSRSKR